MPVQIRIPDTPARLSIRTTSAGAFRITYPRAGLFITGLVLLAAGFVLWLILLPAGAWDEPLVYALGLVLLVPGLELLNRAVRHRPVLHASQGELILRYGPAFFERTLLRLPLDSLEVRVAAEQIEAVRYDTHAVSRRLLAVVSPLPTGRLPRTAVTRHLLQIRTKTQGPAPDQPAKLQPNEREAVTGTTPRQARRAVSLSNRSGVSEASGDVPVTASPLNDAGWLTIFGSLLASDLENARLALLDAGAAPPS